METSDQNPEANTLRWLEDEQRQNKAAYFKLQQQLEQVQSHLWAQGDQIHSVEEALSVAHAQLSRLPKMEEELRQANEMVERFRVAQGEEAQRQGEAERVRQGEMERERGAKAQMEQKLDLLEKEAQSFFGKHQLFEENLRRHQDTLFQAQQGLDNLAHEFETLRSGFLLAQEHTKRQAQDMTNLHEEHGNMRMQDEVILGRVQALAERVKYIEDQEALVSLEEKLNSDFSARLEMHRIERQRLERNLAELQESHEQHHANIEELIQQAARLDGRSQALSEQMTQLRDQAWGLHQGMAAELSQSAQREEEQKRRQIAELERQIGELKAWAARLPKS